nr:hypothetical protein KOBFAEHK_00146 [White spot syndrome virus]
MCSFITTKFIGLLGTVYTREFYSSSISKTFQKFFWVARV